MSRNKSRNNLMIVVAMLIVLIIVNILIFKGKITYADSNVKSSI